VYRNLSHLAERDHHDLPEKTEEQDKPHGPHLYQHRYVVAIGRLAPLHRYAEVGQFLPGVLHCGSAIVQAYAEEWVLQIALKRSFVHIKPHRKGFRARGKISHHHWH